MENENKDALKRLEAMSKLRTAKELYMLVSLCTNMPFVQCDPDTYDDVVYVYETAEDIKREGMRFIEEKQPVQITKLDNQMLLTFYTNLYTMGVNCIVLNGFMENEYKLQLSDLVKKPAQTSQDGNPWIENPAFHLTALYFMQEIRRKNYTSVPPELKDMQDEILAHFANGTFIVLFGEDNRIPILKHPNGDIYQPIFTDLLEVGKFKTDQPLKMGAIPASKIVQVLAKEAKGVVVNPGGVNLQLPITRKAPADPAAAPTSVPAPTPAADGDKTE